MAGQRRTQPGSFLLGRKWATKVPDPAPVYRVPTSPINAGGCCGRQVSWAALILSKPSRVTCWPSAASMMSEMIFINACLGRVSCPICRLERWHQIWIDQMFLYLFGNCGVLGSLLFFLVVMLIDIHYMIWTHPYASLHTLCATAVHPYASSRTLCATATHPYAALRILSASFAHPYTPSYAPSTHPLRILTPLYAPSTHPLRILYALWPT